MFEQMIGTLGEYLFIAFKFFLMAVLTILVCGASFLIGSVLVRLVCCVNARLAKNIYDIEDDHDGWG